MTHPLRTACTIVGGAIAGGFAIAHALVGDWDSTTWALATALLAFVIASHDCPALPAPPAPAPVDRGLQRISFVGGPDDGGEAIVLAGHDLHGTTVPLEDANYTITSVVHTCYRAELTTAESEKADR